MNDRFIQLSSFLPLTLMVLAASIAGGQPRDSFNANGNVYIADQFNNRIIEVDQNGNIVWQFGDGSSVPGPTSIVGPNDAERIDENTLIAGTGAPPGAEPTCPNGCPDNRVILVDDEGNILWQYGQAGVTGSGRNELNTPVFAVKLPNGPHYLIADQGNQRIIEVNHGKQIVWQYGTTGVPGSGPNQLNNPNSAELLSNGDVLIADESNNRVIEVNHAKQIVWHYGDPNDPTILNAAAFASRLPNGNTLITDSGNNRVVEIDPNFNVVFEYDTDNCPSGPSLPTRAVRLRNGDTLVSGQFNDVVVEVDPSGSVVRTIGTLCVTGTGPNQLNAPYDAKVVGDYTGLTPPHNNH
jgi:outer membrane protein assembly factor BamB